jgi:hypothetical protein
MISKKIYLPAFLLFLLLGNNLISEAQNPDVRLRLYGKLQKEISQKIDVDLEYEHRFDKYITSFEKAFMEPSLSYSFNKNIRMGASYRLALNQNNSRQRKLQSRSSAYFQYRFELDDFRFRLRTTMQYGFDDLSVANDFINNKLVSRNSIQIDYDWFGTKLRPYAKYEFFTHLNHPQGIIINQQRMSLGSSYKISKALSVDAFYMFENEMNIVAPVNAHILGAGIEYSF